MSFINPWALLLLPIAYIPFWLKSHQGQMYSWNEIIPEDVFSDRFNLAIKILTSLLLASIVFVEIFVTLNATGPQHFIFLTPFGLVLLAVPISIPFESVSLVRSSADILSS